MWVFWIALIVIVIFVVKTMMSGTGGHGNPDTPLEILKKRYARGEIDEAEFKRRRQELEK